MGATKKKDILALVQDLLGEKGTTNKHGYICFVSECPRCHMAGCGLVDLSASTYLCTTTSTSYSASEFEKAFYKPKEEKAAIVAANPASTKSSRLIAGGVNLVSEDVELDAIAYNEMAGRPFVRGVLPWTGKEEHRAWDNTDAANFCAYVQAKHGINKNDAERVFTIIAGRRKYNPIADVLDALPAWNEQAERSSILIEYLGAADTPYNRAVTELLFNGAVMRALQPGCKFDLCITLVGGQGIGKSTLSGALALREEFFSDNVGNISTKEAAENIQGRWIVEIGELAGFSKKEIETVKLFLSQQWDTYRASYEKYSEQRPRRCIFIATTNSASFLNDYTGARRFLPVRCNEVTPSKNVFDKRALAEDVTQAYAQTMDLYRKHEALPLMLPANLAADALAAQEAFAAEDTKTGLILEWLQHNNAEGVKVCTLQIMRDVFSIDREEANRGANKAMQNEIVAILDNKCPGWVRVNEGRKVMHSREFGQQRCWAFKGPVLP